jgi:hypothetical protein
MAESRPNCGFELDLYFVRNILLRAVNLTPLRGRTDENVTLGYDERNKLLLGYRVLYAICTLILQRQYLLLHITYTALTPLRPEVFTQDECACGHARITYHPYCGTASPWRNALQQDWISLAYARRTGRHSFHNPARNAPPSPAERQHSHGCGCCFY